MFNLQYDDDVHVLFYQSLSDKGTTNVKEIKWSEWCEFLTQPKVSRSNKYANGLAIYGDVDDGVDEKTGEILQHRRLKENVLWRQVFSFDYDEIDNMERFIENIKSKLKHFAYFAYSTYRHRDVKEPHDEQLRPRFRVLIPINDILEPREYEKYGTALNRYIGEKVDGSSLDPIQLSALPTVYDNNVPFHWFNNDAPLITRQQLEKCLFKYPEPKSNIILNTDYTSQYKRRDDAHWKTIMDAGLGESEGRTQQLTSLIGHLQGHGVNDIVALELIKLWNEQHAVPLSESKVEYTYMDLYKRNRRKKKHQGGGYK